MAWSALRDTWGTKKLSVSGNRYGASKATRVNNTWGNTELAGPCVIPQPQVLTSSTKKGDGEHKHKSMWKVMLLTLWPCSWSLWLSKLFGTTPWWIHLFQTGSWVLSWCNCCPLRVSFSDHALWPRLWARPCRKGTPRDIVSDGSHNQRGGGEKPSSAHWHF